MNTELALVTQLGPPEAFYYNCEVNLQLAVESTPTSSAPWCLAVSCRRKNQGNPGGGKKGKKKKEKSSPLDPSVHHTASTMANISIAAWLLISLLAALILYNSSSSPASLA